MSRKPLEKKIHEFCCITCAQKWVSAAVIKRHLTDVHKVTEFKGKREALLFLDGAAFYDNSWKITLADGTILHEHQRGPSAAAVRRSRK